MQLPSNLSPEIARSLHEVKRSHVLAVLAACGGNRTLAAHCLDVDRKTLYRMLLRWGIAGDGTVETAPAAASAAG